jgi:hypothetical protein
LPTLCTTFGLWERLRQQSHTMCSSPWFEKAFSWRCCLPGADVVSRVAAVLGSKTAALLVPLEVEVPEAGGATIRG